YNEGGGRKGGRLKFVEGPAKRSKYRFPFINKTGDYRLFRGALFPMLGAFRWMVDQDPGTGVCSWRGGCQAVLDLWRETGKELMETTQVTSEELGRNRNAIRKSQEPWARLHAIIASQHRITQQ